MDSKEPTRTMLMRTRCGLPGVWARWGREAWHKLVSLVRGPSGNLSKLCGNIFSWMPTKLLSITNSQKRLQTRAYHQEGVGTISASLTGMGPVIPAFDRLSRPCYLVYVVQGVSCRNPK